MKAVILRPVVEDSLEMGGWVVDLVQKLDFMSRPGGTGTVAGI